MGIAAQITLLVILVSVINIAIASLMGAYQLKNSYVGARLDGNIELAASIAEGLRKRALAGEFSMEEAQARTIGAISAIRFEGENYLTILDAKNMKVLTSRVYPTGTDASAIVDKNGKHFFKELTEGAASSQNSKSSAEFYGVMPGSDELVKKLGAAFDYKEWDFVIIASIAEKDLYAALLFELATTLFVGLVLIVLTIVVVRVMFVRRLTKILTEITGGLAGSMHSVSDSATSLQDSSHKLAEGTNEQAASVQEIVATIEESASMIKKTDESSSCASKLARQSKEHATSGYQQMKDLMTSMDKINKANQEVSKIIKVIDEIALQTNILSLNAAVEAEKAGEAGKGFAVVAEEVRSLAQRSAQSVKDTTKLIENNASTFREAARLSENVFLSIKEIEEETGKVNDLINEVASATREQKIGIEQIHAAIAQVEQVLQTSSKTAGETSSESNQLNEQTHLLSNLTEKLTSFVRGA
ncbi:putative methyl-accepting chemotaxis protein [Candidatus Gastranaerophilus sp. (ex Termes propinquus)]|nr:putative methyl-accepting chemotaxis protein [Candidatus Gastranaerophilus sp. (ex Termes propinquus)]